MYNFNNILSGNIRVILFTAFLLLIIRGPSPAQIAVKDSTLQQNRSDSGVRNSRDYLSATYEERITKYRAQATEKIQFNKTLDREIRNLRNTLTQSRNKTTKKSIQNQIKEKEIRKKQTAEEIALLGKIINLLEEGKFKSDPEKVKSLNQLAIMEEEYHNIRIRFDEEISSEIKPLNNEYWEESVCEIQFDGIDSQTRLYRKETFKKYLFGYTQPKLKTYFKDQDYLVCESQVVNINNRYFWILHISISSKDAIKSYGSVEKNSTLKVVLLNREILYLTNAYNTNGKLEAYTGNSLYELVLPLDRATMRDLTRAEIDSIGIMWSSGYEEYQVYEVDVVKNQIDCVQN